MLGLQRTENIFKEILRRAGSDLIEMSLVFEDQSLTRFANNAIHQNVVERNITLIVCVILGKKIGLATSDRLDGHGLDELVSRARNNAKSSPEDPDYPGLPGPAEYKHVEAFDPHTAEYSPEARAKAVGQVCRLAHEKGLNGSGTFSTAIHEIAVANSLGVFAYTARTGADFQTVIMSEDSSGREHGSGFRVDDIPIEPLFRKAIKKAENARHPREIVSGDYTVVLTPYATEDLLNMLNYYGMGAQSVLEGRSWMNDRIGVKAMSELISVWDDGLDSGGVPVPFDFEGVPKQRVDIVKKGVVTNPVHNRITGRKIDQTSTGHALLPTLRSLGPMATNLFMAPGASSIQEMIRSTRRGLYIGRFWYTRLVHPRDCVITGMTRDGVFVVKDGELAYPVKNLRFTQSYVEALANVDRVGRDTRLLTSEFGGYAVRVPALRINGFCFTGSTV